jgi:uridylate kinase
LKPMFRRVLLKLSGEALLGEQEFVVDNTACLKVAKAIKQVRDLGVQIGLVIGGGNIFRGSQAKEFGFARTPADQIGMLATMINGLALQQALIQIDCDCHVMSAIECEPIVETYAWKQASEYLDEGKVLIFVAGTGNPYFTTDTAAALRASEIQADILLKATKVDGIYDKDPMKHPNAKRFETLSYLDVLSQKLEVMDAAALALCRDNEIPIFVFNLFKEGSMVEAVCHKKGGTFVDGG